MNEEKYEISVRILGNEIIAFSLATTSEKKNWVVIGSLVAVMSMLALKELIPVIQQFL